jgi:hypothetical protein
MSSSAIPNFDSVALGRQIIDLNAEVHREVNAKCYERAAALRDQREDLERQLNEFGNPIVARNVSRVLRSVTSTRSLNLLEQARSEVDAELLRLLSAAPLPPRWILNNFEGSCRASVATRLNIDALDSSYFQTRLPVVCAATLKRATHPTEWLTMTIREAARASSPIVWIVEDPAYLADRGVLNFLLSEFRLPHTHFVACLRPEDAAFASEIAEIPGASAMGT